MHFIDINKEHNDFLLIKLLKFLMILSITTSTNSIIKLSLSSVIDFQAEAVN